MMTDRQIDTISMLVFQITGEHYESGRTDIIIRALEAAVNAATVLKEQREYDAVRDA